MKEVLFWNEKGHSSLQYRNPDGIFFGGPGLRGYELAIHMKIERIFCRDPTRIRWVVFDRNLTFLPVYSVDQSVPAHPQREYMKNDGALSLEVE